MSKSMSENSGLILVFTMADHGKRKSLNVHPEKPGSLDTVMKIVGEGLKNPKSALRLIEVSWFRPSSPKIPSTICEAWNVDILNKYAKNCELYGETYFFLCESMKTRKCGPPAGMNEKFASLAEAGEAIAETYLGIPPGVMKYLDCVRLAEDVMAGQGPEELPDEIYLAGSPHGDPIYLFDLNNDGQDHEATETSSPSMSI